MKWIYLFLFSTCCLNLSQAQTTLPPLPPMPAFPTLKDATSTPDPSSVITPPATTNNQSTTAQPSSTAPLGTSTTPVPNPIAPTSTNGAKYTEYQSLCRTHEYDQNDQLSDVLKEKRISLLQEKQKKEPESAKIKIRLLKEFTDQRKLKEAEDQIKEIRKAKLNPADLNYAEAIYSFAKNDRKIARNLLIGILADQPKNVDALKLLAEIYKVDANYYEYTTIYYDLMKITKENYDEQMCEVLTLDSHYVDAEKFCLKGSRETKNPLFPIYLGVAAREKDNMVEAQKYFSASIALKETEMADVCSGEIYLIRKNYDRAQNEFKNAVRINPKSLRAHIALAWAYFYDKNLTESLNSFRNACMISKYTTPDLRKALKILINEKSDKVTDFSKQVERCMNL